MVDNKVEPVEAPRKETLLSLSPPPDKPLIIRDLIGFWILGMGNNFGFVVMLAAAFDLLEASGDKSSKNETVVDDPNRRTCNDVSTGMILLANMIPSMIIKLICSFLPTWALARVLTSIVAQVISFLCIAFSAGNRAVTIVGVCFMSFACGLGEATFLAYITYFNRNVISTWSSGTGGAGIFGALVYAGLRQVGLSPKTTMFLMLTVPILMFIIFMCVLSKPTVEEVEESQQKEAVEKQSLKAYKKYFHKFMIKVKKMPYYIIKYLTPLATIYFLEYLINQGVYEVIEFRKTDWDLLTIAEQYRWLVVGYQVGVLISRSSVNLVYIKYVWILTNLQAVNLVIFVTEAIYAYMPSYWLVLLLTIWEGLLAGGAYVCTFYRILREVSYHKDQELAMSTVNNADSIGITLAGFAAMPIHNAICATPAPKRPTVWF